MEIYFLYSRKFQKLGGGGEQNFYWLPEIFAGYQLFLNSWSPASDTKLVLVPTSVLSLRILSFLYSMKLVMWKVQLCNPTLIVDLKKKIHNSVCDLMNIISDISTHMQMFWAGKAYFTRKLEYIRRCILFPLQ